MQDPRKSKKKHFVCSILMQTSIASALIVFRQPSAAASVYYMHTHAPTRLARMF